MGKCLKCGKTVLGRRRKCTKCKSSKKRSNNTNETFIDKTFSLNKEEETVEAVDQDETINEENIVNETFIEHLVELNISDNDLTEESNSVDDNHNVCYEIDSIYTILKEDNIPIEDGNLTIYTDPKIFTIKKKIYSKIGWIFFLKAGLQCNILTNYTDQWKLSYSL